MTLLTALEIFSNPLDLFFSIPKIDNKYGIEISRGPGHRFKPLLTSEIIFTKEKAIKIIETILNKALDVGANVSKNASEVLTKKQVDNIIDSLKKNKKAKTFDH